MNIDESGGDDEAACVDDSCGFVRNSTNDEIRP